MLEQTLPGLFLGRLLHIHEPTSLRPLTTVKNLKQYATRDSFGVATEAAALVSILGATDELSAPIRSAVHSWVEDYFDALEEPPASARFPSELCPGGRRAMLSLRDVEEQAPVVEVTSEVTR